MEFITTTTQHPRLKPLVPRLAFSLGLMLLASCSALPNDGLSQSSSYPGEPGETSEFTFPQTSCGEQAPQASGTWYVVYIDGANPDEVRREYCQDAIGTLRDDTSIPTVQVASFTNYEKALRFAAAVGGEVEASTFDRPPVATSPSPSPAADGSLAGRTAYLSARDPGSTINIRENPTVTAPVRHAGRVGDAVQVVERTQGEDGYPWYQVTFSSGQTGWVRSDFLSEALGRQPDTTASTGSAASGSYPASGSYNSPDPYNSADSARSNSSTDRYASPSGYSESNRSAYPQTSSVDRYGSSASGTSSYDQPGTVGNDRYRDSTRSEDYSNSESYNSTPYSDPYSNSRSDSASSDTDSTDAEVWEEIAVGEDAVLTATDPGSRINVRTDATTASQVSYVGYAGDAIQITDVMQGEDGYTWYGVELESGEVGWVRGDYVGE